MFVYITMSYGAMLVVLGAISGEDSLVFFGLLLLFISNLHNIAAYMKRRNRRQSSEPLH